MELKDIYLQVYECYRTLLFDGLDRVRRKEVIDKLKVLVSSEKKVTDELRETLSLDEFVSDDKEFFWELYNLYYPDSFAGLIKARVLGRIVDTDYSIEVALSNGVDLAVPVMDDLDITRDEALQLVKMSYSTMEGFFQNYLLQVIHALLKMQDQTVDEELLGALRNNILYILFIYPEIFERALIDGEFNLAALELYAVQMDRLLVDSKEQVFDIYNEDDGEFGALVMNSNVYLSFEHNKRFVTIGNLNAILIACDRNNKVMWEIWKMELHVILRMFDDRASELLMEQMSEIDKEDAALLLNEVIGEIKDRKKLVWEL